MFQMTAALACIAVEVEIGTRVCPTRLCNPEVLNKAYAQRSTLTCCLINTCQCNPVDVDLTCADLHLSVYSPTQLHETYRTWSTSHVC